MTRMEWARTPRGTDHIVFLGIEDVPICIQFMEIH